MLDVRCGDAKVQVPGGQLTLRVEAIECVGILHYSNA